MKANILRQWTRALRSGKFKRTMGGLRKVSQNGVAYCCLGVLCELHRTTAKTELKWDMNDYGGSSSYPPQDTLDWAGLKSEDPTLLAKGGSGSGERAATLNDGGWSFARIAAALERTQKEGCL